MSQKNLIYIIEESLTHPVMSPLNKISTISTAQTVIFDGSTLRNCKIELHTQHQFIHICKCYIQVIFSNRQEWIVEHFPIGWHLGDGEWANIRTG